MVAGFALSGCGDSESGDGASGEETPTATPTTAASDGVEAGDGPSVVRENSHYLDKVGPGAPTLVEFLDFECEACGAVYPTVESLREKYKGKINFVIRYFPTGHANSMRVAQSAEAAARQDKLEPMYERLFKTQKDWAEAQESKQSVFDGFAKDLGLDMNKFKADVNSPEVVQRVKQDADEGAALGVQGTPTFFLNGEQLQIQSVEDLDTAIADAVKTAGQ